jgi:hypothetical protein
MIGQKEYAHKESVILITEQNLIFQKECAIKETVVQVTTQNQD